jgi:hypothetical protein
MRPCRSLSAAVPLAAAAAPAGAARAMMNALTTRISQVLNDELDIDAALGRIEQDVQLAIQAAQ